MLRILLAVMLAAGLSGCAKERYLPDEKLIKIFSDNRFDISLFSTDIIGKRKYGCRVEYQRTQFATVWGKTPKEALELGYAQAQRIADAISTKP